MRRRFMRAAQLALAAVGAVTLFTYAGAAPAASGGADFVLSGWQVVEFLQGQPACTTTIERSGNAAATRSMRTGSV